MYKLTDEGRQYLEEGLPEKKLAKLASKGAVDVKKAKQLENFAVAVQWAKKKNWVVVAQGEIELIEDMNKINEDDEIEKALTRVKQKKRIDNEIAKLLLERKLIKEEKESLREKAESFSGKEVTNIDPSLIQTGLWKNVKFKPYNVTASGEKIFAGKKQPYNEFLKNVKETIVRLGFKEMTGPTIETEFWNFDALYQAQNHPSRDWTETYSMKYPKYGKLPDKTIVRNVKAVHENGWKTGSTGWGYKWDEKKAARLMPRAHTTAVSARILAGNPEIPGKYFSLGRCYRPDVLDATHGVEFNQLEGIVIDPSLTFKDLLGLLKLFAIEIAGAEKVKFYSDYYPFTEPSTQLSAKHPEMGWIEFAGAGIFRKELTEPLGIKEPVIAWGMGIDRLAMFKLGIKDIRYLFSQDLEWLRKQEVI
jgi:phenylalanyl-tRNA synthetase alpha chain